MNIDPNGLAALTVRLGNGQEIVIESPTGMDLLDVVKNASDGSITLLQVMGHGDRASQCISKGVNCSDVLTPNLDVESNGTKIGSLRDILRKKLSSNGQVRLEGCNNASGEANIAKEISRLLGDIPVTG